MAEKEYIERNKIIDRIQELKDNLRNKIFGMTQVIVPYESVFRMVGECFAISNCENIILTIPTADVRENVKGEWIDDKGDNVPWDELSEGCPLYSCYCSVCGEWLTASDEYTVCGRYCPNCGANMMGEKEDE